MKIIIPHITILLIFLGVLEAYGQDKQKKVPANSASSVNPGSSMLVTKPPALVVKKETKKNKSNIFASTFGRIGKKKNTGLNAQFDRQMVEYQERMKQNAKRYRKEARNLSKPQYTDPSYFGHKRKPKKRKPGKRKLCKECKIVH